MTPGSFDSWRSYFRFALCREFIDASTGESFQSRSRMEKVGGGLTALAIKPLDGAVQNFREPGAIAALTAAMLALTTVVFYPRQTIGAAITALPFLGAVRSEHIKASIFIISQLTIFGLGLRTLGRLCDSELMEAFYSRRIVPVSIGTVRMPHE